jgi:hypothetical protein
MNMCTGGAEVQLHSYLTSAPGMVNFMPWPLHHKGKSSKYLLHGRPGGPQSQTGDLLKWKETHAPTRNQTLCHAAHSPASVLRYRLVHIKIHYIKPQLKGLTHADLFGAQNLYNTSTTIEEYLEQHARRSAWQATKYQHAGTMSTTRLFPALNTRITVQCSTTIQSSSE